MCMGRIRSFIYKKVAEDYVRSLVSATGDSVIEVYIVGSVARDEADPSTHDIDLAIVVGDIEIVSSKADELKKRKMVELSDGGITLAIHYELFPKEEIDKNPDLIHKPKKKIYQAKD